MLLKANPIQSYLEQENYKFFLSGIKGLLILLFLWIGLINTCHAQNGDYTIGARSSALANASVTIQDQWSLFNNPGALSYVNQTSLFGAYRNLFSLPELNSLAVGMTSPIFGGTIGLGAFRFGNNLLNEHRVNMAFSNRFGLVSLGANINYFQVNIQGGGMRNTVMFDFGGHAKLSEQFFFGAHISNINQAELSERYDQRIPTLMKSGISYRPTKKVMLNGEIQKPIDDREILKFGLEYKILEQIDIRTGIRTRPFTANFGFGLSIKWIKIDYSYGNHSNLGDIHHFSFIYDLDL